MVNFASSFEKGLQEADVVKNQKKEISLVFEEFKTQIESASNGVIKIAISKKYGNINDNPSMVRSIQTFSDMFMGKNSDSYSSIEGSVSIVDSDYFSLEIARWSTSPQGGFPCKLLYSNNDIEVHDKEALEYSLADLLESPHTGLIFQRLFKKHEESIHSK